VFCKILLQCAVLPRFGANGTLIQSYSVTNMDYYNDCEDLWSFSKTVVNYGMFSMAEAHHDKLKINIPPYPRGSCSKSPKWQSRYWIIMSIQDDQDDLNKVHDDDPGCSGSAARTHERLQKSRRTNATGSCTEVHVPVHVPGSQRIGCFARFRCDRNTAEPTNLQCVCCKAAKISTCIRPAKCQWEMLWVTSMINIWHAQTMGAYSETTRQGMESRASIMINAVWL
jgi:hypothetical protein